MALKEHVYFRGTKSNSIEGFPSALKDTRPVTASTETINSYFSVFEKNIITGSLNQLYGCIIRTILEYMKGPDSAIACLGVGEKTFLVERKMEDGNTVVAMQSSKTPPVAAMVTPTENYCNISGLGTPKCDNFDVSPFIMLVLMCLKSMTDSTDLVVQSGAKQVEWDLNSLLEWSAANGMNYSKLGKAELQAIYRLNSAVRYAVTNNVVNVQIRGGNVDMWNTGSIEMYRDDGVIICGVPNVLGGKSTVHAGYPNTVELCKKHFAAYAATRKWTDDQKRFICSFPNDYKVPEPVFRIAEMFVKTRGRTKSLNNFSWRGCTGCGKSTGIEILSCILNTPLYKMTCNTNMQTDDFLTTLVPVSNDAALVAAMPEVDIETMCYMPDVAYETITGEAKEDAAPEDCLRAYAAAVEAYTKTMVAESKNTSGTSFKLTKSNFVKALEQGAICEVQEYSRIKDPGVLVGVNEYDHAGSNIPLMNGEFTVRHPNAIVVWTDNIGYASCRPVDPSVKRRFAVDIVTSELSEAEVIDRVMYNTDAAVEEKFLKQMYKIWSKTREFCIQNEITDGDLSVTDLESWVVVFANCTKMGAKDFKQTFEECILNKLANTRETRDDIKAAVEIEIDKVLK